MQVVEIDQDFHNLIPSRFPTIDVYERIANGRSEEFAKIEALTNPRLREKERLTRNSAPVDQNNPRFKNWNHAPFAYPSPEGSTFYGPDTRVLELADELQTALAISVRKREIFLSCTVEPATALEMRQLKRPVKGKFLDATGWDGIGDKQRRLELGTAVVEAGHDGILFNPPERPSATAIAILYPECLDHPIQVEHFKFIWNGQKMTVIYSFNSSSTGEGLDPAKLKEKAKVIAA
ncbi:RES family NAD+ phosphorylase [Lacibacterium aquatile]|uniref:RES family NAD+ phosphorylase n=1 Tax=Lacibacterium aquatile TaxID=1168082 RepID=A0ABW5DR73_9PROT